MTRAARGHAGAGAHFNEYGIDPNARELAVLVGSAAFALGGGFALFMFASSVIADGSSAITSSRNVLAAIGGGDVDADAPITNTGDASDSPESPSDADAAVSAPGKADDDGERDEAVASEEPEKKEDEAEPEKEPREQTIHIITWGETLSGISRQYGVSVDAIAAANQIRDVNLIYANSALVIPAA